MDAAPIAVAQFRESLDALLASLGEQGEGTLALAVSGGSDSMALLRLAHDAYPGRIAAVTVDHGLRPSSAAEARQVGEWCRTLGAEHRILRWQGQKPATGLQRRAREARYQLLAEAAAQLGRSGLAAPLIVAHTLDDQAETFLLRLSHGSNIGGLGAMRASSEIPSTPPVPLLRPLLEHSRSALRTTLQAYGQRWIDDPSNEDQRFERVRLRHLLPSLEVQGLRRESLAQAAALMARIDERLLSTAIAACPYQVSPEGVATFGCDAFAGLPLSASIRFLSFLLRVVGGNPYPPGRSSLDGLAARMKANAPGATLGGCALRRSRGTWVVRREARAAARSRTTVSGDACIALWDNRFWVRLPPGFGGGAVVAEGTMLGLQTENGPVRGLVVAEDARAFRLASKLPIALFVGEARMRRELGALWRQVMKDTPVMECYAATLS